MAHPATLTCPTWCTAPHDEPGWNHASTPVETPAGIAWITDPGTEPRIYLGPGEIALSSMSLPETLELIASLGSLVATALERGAA